MSSAVCIPGKSRTPTFLPVSIPDTSFDRDGSPENCFWGLLAADRGDVTLLGLLNLSAAWIRSIMPFTSIVSAQHSESVGQSFLGLTHLLVCERRLSSLKGPSQLDQCLIVVFHRAAYWGLCSSYFTLPMSLTWLSAMVSVHICMQTTHSFTVTLTLCLTLHQYLVWRHSLNK